MNCKKVASARKFEVEGSTWGCVKSSRLLGVLHQPFGSEAGFRSFAAARFVLEASSGCH